MSEEEKRLGTFQPFMLKALQQQAAREGGVDKRDRVPMHFGRRSGKKCYYKFVENFKGKFQTVNMKI